MISQALRTVPASSRLALSLRSNAHAHASTRTSPNSLRAYATEATSTQEGHSGKGGSVPPFSPRKAYSPFYLAGGAVAIITGWYMISKKDPPKTPQVSGIEKALQPKIDANKSGGVAPGESKVTKRA